MDNDQAVFPMVNSNTESSTSNFALGENVQTEVTENEPAIVKMVVMNGIVMGPQHCAFGNCTADLANTRGGVFCSIHEIEYGAKCSCWLSFFKSKWNSSLSSAQSRVVKI